MPKIVKNSAVAQAPKRVVEIVRKPANPASKQEKAPMQSFLVLVSVSRLENTEGPIYCALNVKAHSEDEVAHSIAMLTERRLWRHPDFLPGKTKVGIYKIIPMAEFYDELVVIADYADQKPIYLSKRKA